MKGHSFRLTQEDLWKLQSVQDFQAHANASEALRFCIDFAHEAFCLGRHKNEDRLLDLVKRNNLMLRFLFIELTKMHQGDVGPLTDKSRDYLENLKRQLQEHIGDRDERTPGL